MLTPEQHQHIKEQLTQHKTYLADRPELFTATGDNYNLAVTGPNDTGKAYTYGLAGTINNKPICAEVYALDTWSPKKATGKGTKEVRTLISTGALAGILKQYHEYHNNRKYVLNRIAAQEFALNFDPATVDPAGIYNVTLNYGYTSGGHTTDTKRSNKLMTGARLLDQIGSTVIDATLEEIHPWEVFTIGSIRDYANTDWIKDDPRVFIEYGITIKITGLTLLEMARAGENLYTLYRDNRSHAVILGEIKKYAGGSIITLSGPSKQEKQLQGIDMAARFMDELTRAKAAAN